jgi:hypothetical protein
MLSKNRSVKIKHKIGKTIDNKVGQKCIKIFKKKIKSVKLKWEKRNK